MGNNRRGYGLGRSFMAVFQVVPPLLVEQRTLRLLLLGECIPGEVPSLSAL